MPKSGPARYEPLQESGNASAPDDQRRKTGTDVEHLGDVVQTDMPGPGGSCESPSKTELQYTELLMAMHGHSSPRPIVSIKTDTNVCTFAVPDVTTIGGSRQLARTRFIFPSCRVLNTALVWWCSCDGDQVAAGRTLSMLDADANTGSTDPEPCNCLHVKALKVRRWPIHHGQNINSPICMQFWNRIHPADFGSALIENATSTVYTIARLPYTIRDTVAFVVAKGNDIAVVVSRQHRSFIRCTTCHGNKGGCRHVAAVCGHEDLSMDDNENAYETHKAQQQINSYLDVVTGELTAPSVSKEAIPPIVFGDDTPISD